MTVLKPTVSAPVKALGATVLSFSTRLGLGSDESTITLELIEDCVNGDSFQPKTGAVKVGDPIPFAIGESSPFAFNGILRDWSHKKNPNGETYSATLVDPRSLLRGTTVIVDTYRGQPIILPNYVNVFYYMEYILCDQFGFSGNSEDGTPYNYIIEALNQIQDTYGLFVYSSTGTAYKVRFYDFPGSISASVLASFPKYYRIQGPATTLADLLEGACDLLGCTYFTRLEIDEENIPTIRIGLVDLTVPPGSFSKIYDRYYSQQDAHELTYGQELRQDTTKTVLIGENIHYMAYATDFVPYLGDDPIQNVEGELKQPVIPYQYNALGYWFNKVTLDLDATLITPAYGYGPYQISEYDIRMAMSGFEPWSRWVFSVNAPGSFNDRTRQVAEQLGLTSPLLVDFALLERALTGEEIAMDALQHSAGNNRALADVINSLERGRRDRGRPLLFDQIHKIFSWVENLGETYYGKKYAGIFPNQKLCFYINADPSTANFGKLVYSATPVDSAWADPGTQLLGLGDPYLSKFKNEDGRTKAFVSFNALGILPTPTTPGYDWGFPGGNGDNSEPDPDSMFCWVAREVYGDYRWLIFREWMIHEAPRPLFLFYSKYGSLIAKFIKNKPYLKKIIKYCMDTIINRYRII